MRWVPIALLTALVVAVASGWLSRETPRGAHDRPVVAAERSRASAERDVDGLPREARETLQLIAAGGPFPYDRDGTTFQNRERRLPPRLPGYYREYTVVTPGAADRGARRIVSGGNPPAEYYYTDDHYRSFRRLEAPRP